MNIDKLLALDKSQIKDKRLLFVLTDFIEDYNELDKEEKAEFLEMSSDEIENISNKLVAKYPGIFESNAELEKANETPKKTSQGVKNQASKKENDTGTNKEGSAKKSAPKKEAVKKTEKSDANKKKSSNTDKVDKELEELAKGLKDCRLRIQAYNAKKREGQPKKPPLKRYEKVQRQFISIWNLMPDHLKYNSDVIKDVEKILSKAAEDILVIYRIRETQIEKVQDAIKEKYNEQETKINKDKDE